MMLATLAIGRKSSGPAFLFGVLALFVCLASFGTAVRAQSVKDLPPPPPKWKPKPTPTPKPPEEGPLDVVKVTSNLVMVPVSVTDSQGNAIQGLTKSDFRLIEEGKEQEITDIGNPEQVPLSIALLFDVSSSVSQKGFFNSQQNAAAAFLKLVMKPADKAAIFTITGDATLVQPLASAQTSAAKMLTIPAATSAVPTAFYDTVIAASKYLEANAPSNYRRVIVVLSDGDDNFSSMLRELSRADATAQLSGRDTPAGVRAGLVERHRRAVAQVEQSVQKADAIFYSVNPGGPSVSLNVISTRAEAGMEAIAET